MRLIDADELIRYGKRGTLVYWEDIENAPSIDIVHCGECKWNASDGCFFSTADRTLDDFCSYGCRSEKPNNCDTCKHWWKSEEVCLLDDCQYEPQTDCAWGKCK